MPNAIVTKRKVKNKNTGLDLTIPTYRKTTGLLSATVEYNIVVVSTLQCFKTAKHKESDVVQFALDKQYHEFETLRKQLIQQFLGTPLPTLPTSLLVFSDTNVRQRKSSLEEFVSVIAKTPKLISCQVTLEFLGVNALTAANFHLDENTNPVQRDTTSDIFEEQQAGAATEEGNKNAGLIFGEDNQGEDADDMLFAENITLSDTNTQERVGPQLFSNPDLSDAGVDLTEENMFVPGAHETGKRQVLFEEDSSDILSIDDDLKNILEISKKPSPAKNKPNLPPKPGTTGKPQPPPKPSAKQKSRDFKNTGDDVGKLTENISIFQATADVDEMGDSDILAYIQQNVGTQDNDVDLFS